MATLVGRLAGPMQSWGVEPVLRTAGTHTTPSWSGLLGLCRAALGHGRADPWPAVAWLRDLRMAVRVDQAGRPRTDFHTINPLPASYERFAGVDPGDRGLVPLGTALQSSGQAPRWLKGKAPMITRRAYLDDACFSWFADGPDGDIDRLARAFAVPRWALSLGRKGCPPAQPLLLGVHPSGIEQVAPLLPCQPTRRGGDDAPVDLELVWLNGHPADSPAGLPARVVLDVPSGSHPQDPHLSGRHLHGHVRVHPGDPLAWAQQQLSHPARSHPEETP